MKYIIYRISVADCAYIGSTKDFKQRKRKHKNACNNVNNPSHNLKVYQIIRENGGWNCCEMIPIEECECENTIQVHIREEELRKEYNAEMNTNKAFHNKQEYNIEYWILNKKKLEIKKKEYYETNKEEFSQRKKEWYEKNKEAVLQKLNEKYNCVCGGCYTHGNKSKHIKTKKHLAFVASNTISECNQDDNVSF